MATIYAKQAQGVIDGTKPFIPGDAAFLHNRVHSILNFVDLAAPASGVTQVASGDTIVWGSLPVGAVPIGGFLIGSVSMGTATLDVGTSDTAALYRAAATFTAVDTPTWFMKGAGFALQLTKNVLLQSVIGTAALPNAATNQLGLAFFYATPHAG